jgi:hypothetical protein
VRLVFCVPSIAASVVLIVFSPTNAKLLSIKSRKRRNHITQPFRPDKSVRDRHTGRD